MDEWNGSGWDSGSLFLVLLRFLFSDICFFFSAPHLSSSAGLSVFLISGVCLSQAFGKFPAPCTQSASFDPRDVPFLSFSIHRIPTD